MTSIHKNLASEIKCAKPFPPKPKHLNISQTTTNDKKVFQAGPFQGHAQPLSSFGGGRIFYQAPSIFDVCATLEFGLHHRVLNHDFQPTLIN